MRKLVLLAAVLMVCGLLYAQRPTDAASPRPQLKTLEDRKAEWYAEHHIILNVAVRDAAGKPVEGLTAKDVTLLDDGSEVRLQSFREMRGEHPLEPVHAVLVLDELDSTARELADERRALEAYFGRGRLEYLTALAVVSDAGARMGEATRDGAVLLAQLRGLQLVSQVDEPTAPPPPAARSNTSSMTGLQRESIDTARWHLLMNLNRRFERAVPALLTIATREGEKAGRGVVIWLGQGWPLLNNPEFVADSEHSKASYFQSAVLLEHALRAGQVTLFEAGMRRYAGAAQDEYTTFLAPVINAAGARVGNLGLQVLAVQSGGAVMDGGDDVAREIEDVLKRAEPYYSIGFDARAAAGPDEYHSLQVKLRGRGDVVAVTKTGYYDQP